MKINPKNSLTSIMLIMSMLLFFDICFQEIPTSSVIELCAENHPNGDYIDSDSELNEEDQLVFASEFFALPESITHHNYFHSTTRLKFPFFPVWQPPKLI